MTPIIITQTCENRNRRAIWFNQPFCKLTNIVTYFQNLLDTYFNRDNPLKKFNGSTVKISYSCTNNMHSILNNHNRRLLDELNWNMEDLMRCSVTLEEKGNAPRADDATRRTSHIKCEFLSWNIIIIIIGRGFI